MSAGTTVSLAAVDLGASSGRVILGRVGPGTLELTELHRFRNGPVTLPDGLYWDILGLYQGILTGLRSAVPVPRTSTSLLPVRATRSGCPSPSRSPTPVVRS